MHFLQLSAHRQLNIRLMEYKNATAAASVTFNLVVIAACFVIGTVVYRRWSDELSR
jgi:hypothetical protein